MRSVIRHITRKSQGEVAIRETTAEGEHLFAGRGNDCGVHLPDPRMLLRHAEFEIRSGSLYVTAFPGADLRVGGSLSESHRLSIGQKIRVGPYEVTVEEPAPNADVTLSVELVQPLGNDLERLLSRAQTETARVGLSIRGWAWLFAVAVVALVLIVPLARSAFMSGTTGASALNPSSARPHAAATAAWTSGPVSPAHKFFGDDCGICHRKVFSSVPDGACLQCHKDILNHADPTRFKMSALADSDCQDCHKEHRGSISIAAQQERFCSRCHADLSHKAANTTILNVSDFAVNHPEFRPTVITDPVRRKFDRSHAITDTPAPQQQTGLIFPHNKHLQVAGVRNGQGTMVKLSCNACHVPDQTGVNMRPINFERDCHSCHQMKFDAQIPDRELLHVAAADVFKQVRDVYDALALRGGYQEAEAPEIVRHRPGTILTTEEKKVVGDWAAAKAMSVLDGRFGKGLCAECHTMVDKPNASTDTEPAAPTWDVQPVILNAAFYPRAEFSHAKHLNTECRFCHDAAQSVSLSEVMVPGIKVCRACHGNEKATDRVPSTCTLCHTFHHQGTLTNHQGEPVLAPDAPAPIRKTAETTP